MHLTGLGRNPVEEGSPFLILTVKGGGGAGERSADYTMVWGQGQNQS